VPGRFLVHSDLHNHSLLSDGDGDPDGFYPAMRAAGLDSACLTDHGIMGKFHGEVTCMDGNPCSDYVGINESRWQRLVALADEHDRPEEFVAFRAFEWSSATVGHLNVWFSEQWIDAMATGSLTSLRATRELRNVDELPLPPELFPILNELPETASIDGFYEWLEAQPGSGPLGGGADALAGFNHPNEFGDFEGFKPWPGLLDRVVSCEALNSDRDFFHRASEDGRSPYTLNACLNAGWRVGLLGTSDEHGTEYARPGLGRGGLWVKELTRAGVREALEARAMFATLEVGLRLAASANGVPMGSTVAHRSGVLRLELDLDRGPGWGGKELVVQLVRPGEAEPILAEEFDITVGASGGGPIELAADVDANDGEWLFIRIVDPDREAPADVPSPWSDRGGAVAYTSPWWLSPEAAASPGPASGGRGDQNAATAARGTGAGSGLPATGGGAAVAAASAIVGALLRRRGRG
jgi:hypothetical protein